MSRIYKDKQDREPSILAKATMLVAGGIALKKMNRGSAMFDNIDRFIGAVSKSAGNTIETFGSTRRRDMTYDMITSTVKKNFLSEDSIYKTVKNQKPVLNLRTQFKGGINSLQELHYNRNNYQAMEKKLADQMTSESVMGRINKGLGKTKSKNIELNKQIKIMVDSVLQEKGKYFSRDSSEESYEVINNVLVDRIKGTKFEKHGAIIKEALEFSMNDESIIQKARDEASSLNKATEKKFKESIKEMYGKGSKAFSESVLDNAATVGDLLKAQEEKTATVIGDMNLGKGDESFMGMLQGLVDEDSDFADVVLDNALIKKRQLDEASTARGVFGVHSLSNMQKAYDTTMESTADSILGKLFHVRSFYNSSKAPAFAHFGMGSYDSVISKHLGNSSGVLTHDVFKIENKFWKATDGGLEHIKTLDDAELISGDHGSLQVLLNKMTGNVTEKYHTDDFKNKFDIGTIQKLDKSLMSNFFGKFNKESNWIRHKINRLMDSTYELTTEDYTESLDVIDNINYIFNTNMRAPSTSSIRALKSKTTSSSASHLLGTLEEEDVAKAIIDSKIQIENNNLDLLLKQYMKGDKSTAGFMQIGSGNRYKGLNIISFDELLKREVVRESIIKETKQHDRGNMEGYSYLASKIRDMDIDNNEKKTLSELSSWTLLQDTTKTYAKHSREATNISAKQDKINKIKVLMSSGSDNDQSNAFFHDFKDGITGFVAENTSYADNIGERDYTLKQSFNNNSYMVVNKNIGLKQIADLNKSIMDGAKQFVAGKGNEENITKATLVAYHMINRLTTPFEEVGLGISSKYAGNVIDLLKHSGTKRILPAIIAGTAISYANYESENLTGTSLVESFQNARATGMLGVKTIVSNLGMDNMMESGRQGNPLSEYYGGEEYRDKDEYLDYLENGYDPVRKGRFWSFGSSSEFRGGKISYWKPNALRRAHSNYYDISMYGSSEEKWKHSWMPTLRHPLSPLKALMNPYWLEEANYDERPYPVSGKLFAEGSPWAAPLNATIGRIIKPQKKMHQEDLQGTMVDVRTIVDAENKKIMDGAAENRIIRFDNSGVSNMTFAPDSMPSMSESVYTVDRTPWGELQGKFAGQDYAESLQTFEDMKISPNGAVYGGNMVKGSGVIDWQPSSYRYMEGGTAAAVGYGSAESSNNGFSDFVSNVATGVATSGAMGSSQGITLIESLNNDILSNAEARQDGVVYESGREAGNAIYAHNDKLDNEFYANENISNIGSMNEFVRETTRSMKQTSGIYGFMFDAVTNQEQGYKLAQAGEMNSFGRRFWDSSVGGTGGGVMEIARRFFPSTDRSVTSINPIRNTQPLWLPSRFHTGNPFDAIPDGEARLPGRGYEALNKLHPDKYGRYGSFDRFKIIADVSPMSEEYKIWNKIAKSEAKNPEMKKEIAAIEVRAKAQNQEHDFYEYKFLGRELKTENVVVREVTNTGEFTTTAGDETFKLAGIKPVIDDAGESQVHNYLKAGMRVSISFEDNEFRNKTKKGEISAIVSSGGQSITKQMIEDDAAVENMRKETLVDEYFNLSQGNIDRGHIFEAIGHAQVPFFHNKFMRIDSPLESYRKEQVYGSPFSTWDNPIKGFVQPAFQNAFAQGPIAQAVGLGTFALSEYAHTTNWDKHLKVAAHTTFALTNPAAFAGGMIGAIPKLGISTGASKYINSKTGARVGAIVGATGYAMANLENPLLSAGNFAAVGFMAARQLKIDELSTRTGVLHDIGRAFNVDEIGGKHGAILGAAVGLGLSAIKNPEFSLGNLNERYIPDDTKKKWEIEEYFDRLEFAKYQNLYKIAARKAKSKEGVDVAKQIRKFEYARDNNADEIEELQSKLEDAEKIVNEELREKTVNSINGQVASLITQEQIFAGGEYTKAAVAYKKAMSSTVYGLTEHSSVADVLRSLPKYDRDYFLEFAKEKDPKAREKILSHVSPYKKRALEVLWRKRDIEEVESNEEYFKDKALPNLFWAGWKPEVNLDNVQMKSIENEGMLLSDFGMYDSNKNSQAYQEAPEIQNINATASPLAIKRDMMGLLAGVNLQGMEVSVEPQSEGGLSFVTNIIRTGTYNLKEKTNEALFSIF